MAESGKSKGAGKGKSKDKGKSRVPKKTPEERGFQLLKGRLHVRPPQLEFALRLHVTPAGQQVELGNLEAKSKGMLPPGHADLEVLCNRQSVLGNPFSMLRASGKGTADDDTTRDVVCDAFETFLQTVLLEQTAGDLASSAEATARDLGLPVEMVGKDWARDFGSTTCEDFREAFQLLQLLQQRHGVIRLLCHCVPKRCHTQSLAARLPHAAIPSAAVGEGVEQTMAMPQQETRAREVADTPTESTEPGGMTRLLPDSPRGCLWSSLSFCSCCSRRPVQT
eukprot:TRINITY_DN34372_c0_g1_i1.p1 TRINITY_DN34372_c0_g1~~TRINITY_DN34372_c0_g1_i1.p1  ORF type:complete len:297 (-),score=57.68 TRINITY_DN34372_c0_g1_i1:114-953(-)